MATVLTLQARLSEAESALHLLAQGKRAVTVQYENRTVTYTQATMADLTAYIDRLKAELATATAATGGARRIKQYRLHGSKGF